MTTAGTDPKPRQPVEEARTGVRPSGHTPSDDVNFEATSPTPTGTDNERPQIDYRASLAAERTFLAYLRTGLALVAAGVAVVAALPDASDAALRRGIGLGLVLAGGVVSFTARRRLSAIVQTMERGEPLPRSKVVPLLGLALLVVAVACAVLVLTV